MRAVWCTVLLAVAPLAVAQGGWEAALGAQLAGDAEKRTIPIENPAVRTYIERVGDRLAVQLPPVSFRYTLRAVVDSSASGSYEPLSFPGGFVLVPAGLILAARNEAEFAGMLAHAMAHAALHHGTRQVTAADMAPGSAPPISTLPLVFMGGWAGFGGAEAAFAVPLQYLALQRKLELEADAQAVRGMAGAGYNPNALLRYLERVPADLPGQRSGLPAREVRLGALERTIQMVRWDEGTSVDGFAGIQEEVRRSVPENPGKGDPPTLRRAGEKVR